MEKLTHIDENGNAVMVDVSDKADTVREATAFGTLSVSQSVMDAILSHQIQKGDVLTIAQIAGIMGAKRTSYLIPLCHPSPFGKCNLLFTPDPEHLKIKATCTVKTTGQTGVEMEALTGVSVALLTVYDMCKALDKGMVIEQIYLLHKIGGKSGDYHRKDTE